MKIYADTSFLVSLYLKTDSLHAPAVAEVGSWKQAPELPLTPFALVEIENTLSRLVHKGKLNTRETTALLGLIKEDVGGGFLRSAPLRAYTWLETARDLSRSVTPHTGTRTLDVLHLSVAHAEECTHLASFDVNQRRAAAAMGLKLIPAVMPRT
ncbi:MAG: type II toxin-antitoxin system VapC family toxin [Opitutaceae bacterium]|nr:type II toxin-antitoxin system VapC family toxin [Opitutaceae bacterium]